MKWRKHGIVYVPDGSLEWAKTHATCPTPYLIDDKTLRIYFASRDANNVGRVGYVDVNPKQPTEVLAVAKTPALDIGLPGTFDDNGVVPTSVLKREDGKIFLYYAGFELSHHIRYRMLTGLAVSADGGKNFERICRVPVLERSDAELYFRSGPDCLAENGIVRAWYAGGAGWVDLNGKQMPAYDIRYVESKDGIHWPAEGAVHIAVSNPDEHGFGRPCVIPKKGGGYRMFYSVRRKSFQAYRMGYAESADGHAWTRMDSAMHLDVTPGAFDSDAIMYAAPVELGGKLHVFYNGNEFGRDGFAVASLEEE